MLFLFQRCLAYIVDALLIFGIWSFLPFTFMEDSPAIAKGIIAVIYFTVMDVFFCASIGKKLLGLEVVDTSGEYPNPIQILFRNVLKMVGIYYYCISYVTVPVFSRAFHDFITRTEVVEAEDEDYDDD